VTSSTTDNESYGLGFWIGLAVGWAVIGYGVLGVLDNVWLRDRPAKVVIWVGSTLIVHDVLLAPLVTVVGLALAWLLPRWLRGPIAGALALSGLVLLFSYPLLRAFGRRPSNTTILPHDYGHNVVLVLGVVWSVALGVVLARMVRGRADR
jgi:hypothetical protein